MAARWPRPISRKPGRTTISTPTKLRTTRTQRVGATFSLSTSSREEGEKERREEGERIGFGEGDVGDGEDEEERRRGVEQRAGVHQHRVAELEDVSASLSSGVRAKGSATQGEEIDDEADLEHRHRAAGEAFGDRVADRIDRVARRGRGGRRRASGRSRGGWPRGSSRGAVVVSMRRWRAVAEAVAPAGLAGLRPWALSAFAQWSNPARAGSKSGHGQCDRRRQPVG